MGGGKVQKQGGKSLECSVHKALARLEGDLAALHLLVDVVGDVDERLLDVLRGLGRRLEEEQPVLLRKLLTLLCLHHTAVVEICLVANQHDRRVLARVLPAVLQPRRQVVKRLAPRDVVHKPRINPLSIVCSVGAQFFTLG